MTLPVSRRVQRVKPSPTLAVTARAARLKAEGKDVIGLGAGEPDFDTPRAHRAGRHRGHPQRLHALHQRRWHQRAQGRDHRQVRARQRHRATSARRSWCPRAPSRRSTTSAWRCSTRATRPSSRRPTGCPIPTWCCWPTGCRSCRSPAPRRATRSPPRQLAAAITPKTRLVLLNSPCNPTGAAYTRAELRALGEVLLEHPRIIIGTDDMYEKIYWEPEPFCSLAARRCRSSTPHRDHQRRVEGLRHDRLAHRLLRRAEGAHRGDGHHPGPVDLQRLQHLAEGGGRGAHRRSGLRREDERGVQGAARLRRARAQLRCPA